MKAGIASSFSSCARDFFCFFGFFRLNRHIQWGREIHFNIRFNDGYRVIVTSVTVVEISLYLDDFQRVKFSVKLELDRLSLRETRKLSQPIFQDCSRVCNLQKIRCGGPKLHESTLRQHGTLHINYVSVLEMEVLHQPIGNTSNSLWCHKFQHSTVNCRRPLYRRVRQLKQHGIRDLPPHKSIQCTRRKVDLISSLCIGAILASFDRNGSRRVDSVAFFESLSGSCEHHVSDLPHARKVPKTRKHAHSS
mmetsp:Transcript_8401/g.22439  ORF Transcript_8401/g.22439 Transcript_8401/m.22439 type:complete len:249 (+) Transcript_8401:718-1464(+)